MSDQPKKQELPPLDDGLVDFPQKDNAADVLNQVAIKRCRERQLLAALSDNEAKDARIAELERRAEYADTLYRGQADRDGVRIAELEAEREQSLRDSDFIAHRDHDMQAKLRAVSEALEKADAYCPLCAYSKNAGHADWCEEAGWVIDDPELFTRLRAIVEGK